MAAVPPDNFTQQACCCCNTLDLQDVAHADEMSCLQDSNPDLEYHVNSYSLYCTFREGCMVSRLYRSASRGMTVTLALH